MIWSPCKQQWVVVSVLGQGRVCCLCFEPDLSLLVVNCCMNSYTNLYWLLLFTTCTSLVSLLGSNLTNNCLLPSLRWVVTCHIRWQDVSWVVVKGVLLWQLQLSGRSFGLSGFMGSSAAQPLMHMKPSQIIFYPDRHLSEKQKIFPKRGLGARLVPKTECWVGTKVYKTIAEAILTSVR